MPVSPLVVASEVLGRPHLAGQHAEHEKGELSSGFGEHIRGVGKRNLIAVGVGAIDVVEAHGKLGNNFQRVLAGVENFSVDGIAQRGDQAVDAGFHLVDNEAFRGRLGLRVDFDFITAVAQQIDGWSDIAGGKDAEFVRHIPYPNYYARVVVSDGASKVSHTKPRMYFRAVDQAVHPS